MFESHVFKLFVSDILMRFSLKLKWMFIFCPYIASLSVNSFTFVTSFLFRKTYPISTFGIQLYMSFYNEKYTETIFICSSPWYNEKYTETIFICSSPWYNEKYTEMIFICSSPWYNEKYTEMIFICSSPWYNEKYTETIFICSKPW